MRLDEPRLQLVAIELECLRHGVVCVVVSPPLEVNLRQQAMQRGGILVIRDRIVQNLLRRVTLPLREQRLTTSLRQLNCVNVLGLTLRERIKNIESLAIPALLKMLACLSESLLGGLRSP